jgi:hypothetical protein
MKYILFNLSCPFVSSLLLHFKVIHLLLVSLQHKLFTTWFTVLWSLLSISLMLRCKHLAAHFFK